jgi:hypothetical protein
MNFALDAKPRRDPAGLRRAGRAALPIASISDAATNILSFTPFLPQ